MNQEIIERLIPISGFYDEKTGLLCITTPDYKFEDFIRRLEELEYHEEVEISVDGEVRSGMSDSNRIFDWANVDEDDVPININETEVNKQ